MMADKFKDGQHVIAQWIPATQTEPRPIPVTVITQESPGMYRCQTNMGVAMLFKEDDLG